jgi:hypothetical protein
MKPLGSIPSTSKKKSPTTALRKAEGLGVSEFKDNLGKNPSQRNK